MGILYGVFQRNTVSSDIGPSIDVYCLKGLYKDKKNAEAKMNIPFMEKGFVCNAVMLEIDTDLFDLEC